jgi:hypothetical protein
MNSARRTMLVLAVLPFLLASYPIAAPNFSDWSAPVNVGPIINSTSVEAGPAISKNGLSLYLHSNRLGGLGDNDIWVAQRTSLSDPWGVPVNLGSTINTSFAETVPAFSRDGHWMFFASTRAGGFGDNDIWVSHRTHTHDDFGWQPAVNLGGNINTTFFDAGPTFFENDEAGLPLLYFVSNRPGGLGGNDVYVSEWQPDGSFGPAMLVAELNSPINEGRPTIRHDGLEIIFFSNRPGSVGLQDLWFSTRDTIFSVWSPPERLGEPVNTASDDLQPAVSSDRTTLFFASTRPGGFGASDLYLTTRVKAGRH